MANKNIVKVAKVAETMLRYNLSEQTMKEMLDMANGNITAAAASLEALMSMISKSKTVASC